jgi:ubiquinone/menaquinone biosynthesis C-methylase UbiE
MSASTSNQNSNGSFYRPELVAQYFDEFGARDWERLIQNPADEVSLHLHRHYLKKYITTDQMVLEIGAGAGRFTQILEGLGAKILVADISQAQLELNKKYSTELGFRHAIIDWRQVDACAMSQFASRSFDAVVAYGGLFSYVLEKRDQALVECLRVLKPGGILLLSVMSLWGSAHGFLNGVLSTPPESNQKITNTGDITPATYPQRQQNFMHLFRSGELIRWLEQSNLAVTDISASNCISLTWNEALGQIRGDTEKWNELLRMELEAGADEGCLNLGTHIIAVARKKS